MRHKIDYSNLRWIILLLENGTKCTACGGNCIYSAAHHSRKFVNVEFECLDCHKVITYIFKAEHYREALANANI